MRGRIIKVDDNEIERSFHGTNFGAADKRKLLETGILKRLCGYSNGSTLKRIMYEMGLTTKADNPTKRGKDLCMDAFYRRENSE